MGRFRKATSSGRVTPLPRRRRRSLGMYKLVVASGVILLFLLTAVIGAQSIRQHRLRGQLDDYHARIEEYELRNETVRAEIERLDELSYIEMLARKYLGLVKPGDTVFQLKD